MMARLKIELMKVAIQITEINKAQDPHLFRDFVVGSFYIGAIPKTYYAEGELYLAYHKADLRHVYDGFLPLVAPEYNLETQELLSTFTKIGDEYVYDIRDLSDDEIFDRAYPNQILTQLQFRTLLETELNIMESDIDFLIDQMEEGEEKRLIKREWLYDSHFNMKNPMLYVLLEPLNQYKSLTLTKEDVYNMFQNA